MKIVVLIRNSKEFWGEIVWALLTEAEENSTKMTPEHNSDARSSCSISEKYKWRAMVLDVLAWRRRLKKGPLTSDDMADQMQ